MHARHQSRGWRCCAHTKGACSQPDDAHAGRVVAHAGGGGQWCTTAHGGGAQCTTGAWYAAGQRGTTTGSVRVEGGGALRRRISSSEVQCGIFFILSSKKATMTEANPDPIVFNCSFKHNWPFQARENLLGTEYVGWAFRYAPYNEEGGMMYQRGGRYVLGANGDLLWSLIGGILGALLKALQNALRAFYVSCVMIETLVRKVTMRISFGYWDHDLCNLWVTRKWDWMVRALHFLQKGIHVCWRTPMQANLRPLAGKEDPRDRILEGARKVLTAYGTMPPVGALRATQPQGAFPPTPLETGFYDDSMRV